MYVDHSYNYLTTTMEHVMTYRSYCSLVYSDVCTF